MVNYCNYKDYYYIKNIVIFITTKDNRVIHKGSEVIKVNEIKNSNIVTKANNLVEASYKLTTLEQKSFYLSSANSM